MSDPTHADVKAAFLDLWTLQPAARAAALAALPEPVRLAVGALLEDAADDTPLFGAMGPAAVDPIRAALPALVGCVLSDRYEVQLLTAEGGGGWIYRGLDLRNNDPVAVKLFKPLGTTENLAHKRAAFARECTVLAELSGENAHIVDYRDAGTWFDPAGREYAWLVMEWLDGPTLADLIQNRDGVSLERACRELAPIAEALGCLHARGVAHRDVKPANIICAGDPATPVLRLVDFGTVKLASDRARGFDSTTTRIGMMTVDYSAPEQFDKSLGASGPWTDVYALAMLLLELMLGRHPWRGRPLFERVGATVDPRKRPTPRAFGLTISDPVEVVFAAALALRPKRRPKDAAMLWRRLGQAMSRTSGRWWRR